MCWVVKGMMDGDKKEGDTKEDEEEIDDNEEAEDDNNSNHKVPYIIIYLIRTRG